MVNKYISHAHIPEPKFRQLLKLFCIGLNAVQIVILSGLSQPTVNQYNQVFRIRIAELCEAESLERESDQARILSRINSNGWHNGKRDGKKQSIMIGIRYKEKKIHTKLLPEALSGTIHKVFAGEGKLEDIKPEESWQKYNALADLESGRLLGVNGKEVTRGEHLREKT